MPFVESTVSICPIEEVAAATARPPWFQLYVMRDRGYTKQLMGRARAAGCEVLALTVDLAVVGARHRDTRNAVVGEGLPLRARVGRALDLLSHPDWIRRVAIGGKPLTFGNLEDAVPGARTPEAFRDWVDAQFDPASPGTTSPGCARTGTAASWSRACSTRRTPAARSRSASTA